MAHVFGFSRIAALAVFACVASLTTASIANPPRAMPSPATPAPVKPAPPCPFTAGPAVLQTQWANIGGARTLGCYVRQISDGEYQFGHGKMAMMPGAYGGNANLEAYVDPSQFIHLYWSTAGTDFDSFIVRLSYNDSLVNQQTYKPGDRPYGGDVENSYGTGVIVHPGDRHGAIQVAVEGCFTFGGLHKSECWGFGTLTFNL